MNNYQEIGELSFDELNELTGFIGEIVLTTQKRATEEISAYLQVMKNHNKEMFNLLFDNDLCVDQHRVRLVYINGVNSSEALKQLRNRLAKKYALQKIRSILEEERESKQKKK